MTAANPVTENAMNISSTKYETNVIEAAMVKETIARVQKYGSVHLISGCFIPLKGPNAKRESNELKGQRNDAKLLITLTELNGVV